MRLHKHVKLLLPRPDQRQWCLLSASEPRELERLNDEGLDRGSEGG